MYCIGCVFPEILLKSGYKYAFISYSVKERNIPSASLLFDHVAVQGLQIYGDTYLNDYLFRAYIIISGSSLRIFTRPGKPIEFNDVKITDARGSSYGPLFNFDVTPGSNLEFKFSAFLEYPPLNLNGGIMLILGNTIHFAGFIQVHGYGVNIKGDINIDSMPIEIKFQHQLITEFCIKFFKEKIKLSKQMQPRLSTLAHKLITENTDFISVGARGDLRSMGSGLTIFGTMFGHSYELSGIKSLRLEDLLESIWYDIQVFYKEKSSSKIQDFNDELPYI